jgi:hypothetical protein
VAATSAPLLSVHVSDEIFFFVGFLHEDFPPIIDDRDFTKGLLETWAFFYR